MHENKIVFSCRLDCLSCEFPLSQYTCWFWFGHRLRFSPLQQQMDHNKTWHQTWRENNAVSLHGPTGVLMEEQASWVPRLHALYGSSADICVPFAAATSISFYWINHEIEVHGKLSSHLCLRWHLKNVCKEKGIFVIFCFLPRAQTAIKTISLVIKCTKLSFAGGCRFPPQEEVFQFELFAQHSRIL